MRRLFVLLLPLCSDVPLLSGSLQTVRTSAAETRKTNNEAKCEKCLAWLLTTTYFYTFPLAEAYLRARDAAKEMIKDSAERRLVHLHTSKHGCRPVIGWIYGRMAGCYFQQRNTNTEMFH